MRTSGNLFAFQHIESDSRPRFLSVMITRLLLSLKKADAPNEHEWSLGDPTTHTTIKFADRRLGGGVTSRDEIHLVTFSSTQEGTESQE